jgi:hypothetical protein
LALRAQFARRPDAIVLMDTSVYPHIVALSGIPLRQTINESDKEYYQAALQSPAQHVSLVLTLAGDQIDQAVHDHPAGLVEIGRFSARDQPAVTLYTSDTSRSIDARTAPEAVVASAKEKLP